MPVVPLSRAAKILVPLGYQNRNVKAMQRAALRERKSNIPEEEREYVWDGTRWYLRKRVLDELVRKAFNAGTHHEETE